MQGKSIVYPMKAEPCPWSLPAWFLSQMIYCHYNQISNAASIYISFFLPGRWRFIYIWDYLCLPDEGKASPCSYVPDEVYVNQINDRNIYSHLASESLCISGSIYVYPMKVQPWPCSLPPGHLSQMKFIYLMKVHPWPCSLPPGHLSQVRLTSWPIILRFVSGYFTL